MTILLYALLAFLLYKFIFGFIIPLWRTTRQIKKSFREMRDKMEGMGGDPFHPGQPGQPADKAPKQGDYIDFEEVK